MKIISLNLWGGIVHDPLLEFIKERSTDVDIFCFQEVVFGDNDGFSQDKKVKLNLFLEISNILTEFIAYKYQAKSGSYFGGEKSYLPYDSQMGQAVFVRKGIAVNNNGGIRTYRENSSHDQDIAITVTGNFQYLEIKDNFIIGNLHGVWQEEGKGDTPTRLEQSKIVVDFINKQNLPVIIIGDFNMLPETESMKILENNHFNLIKDYQIASTRSSLYKKNIPFSDYALIPKEIKVSNFFVLDILVSDHLPLLLDLEIK